MKVNVLKDGYFAKGLMFSRTVTLPKVLLRPTTVTAAFPKSNGVIWMSILVGVEPVPCKEQNAEDDKGK